MESMCDAGTAVGAAWDFLAKLASMVIASGGNDVLEGGGGMDSINGDGLVKTGFMNSAAAALHGADFLDGGLGDDTLVGSGGNDVVYGGGDNDQMWGDVSADNVATPAANEEIFLCVA